MNIGLVDLDTSHPAGWAPILKDLGHTVVGVVDHGDVHPAGYPARFVAEHDAGRHFDSLQEMAEAVDCAIIHACDWDRHVERARPFVEAGRAVLIDKPLAGSLADLNRMRRWAGRGVRITGGSSLRFAAEVRAFLDQGVEQRGVPHTVFCGCGVDEYNYGIHAYALLSAILGPGIRAVRHLGAGAQRRIEVDWGDGRMGLLSVGPVAQWLPFYAMIVTDRGATPIQVDSSNLYRSLLSSVLDYLAARTDEPPIPFETLIEPELCALAAKCSWEQQNRLVRLDELTEADAGYDGAAFAASYREQKYPSSSGR